MKGLFASKALLMMTAAVTAAPSMAQTAPVGGSSVPSPSAPAEDQDQTSTQSGLVDIVVTATRREQKLQDVPVAVTAVTSESLGRSGAADIRNLTQVVPGFFGGRAAGVFLPVIRGVGSSSISVGDESNVATYVDGIYQGDPFFHLDRSRQGRPRRGPARAAGDNIRSERDGRVDQCHYA